LPSGATLGQTIDLADFIRKELGESAAKEYRLA